MSVLHLKIITPQKIALEEEVFLVSVPTTQGEITILPHHLNLFAMLREGIIKIKPVKDDITPGKEKFLAIGAGYLETDGEEINILVSRVYGQDEIDAEQTQKAIEDAKKILVKASDEKQRQQAISTIRRSVINMKLLRKRHVTRNI